jgi:hypothetical protein
VPPTSWAPLLMHWWLRKWQMHAECIPEGMSNRPCSIVHIECSFISHMLNLSKVSWMCSCALRVHRLCVIYMQVPVMAGAFWWGRAMGPTYQGEAWVMP